VSKIVPEDMTADCVTDMPWVQEKWRWPSRIMVTLIN